MPFLLILLPGPAYSGPDPAPDGHRHTPDRVTRGFTGDRQLGWPGQAMATLGFCVRADFGRKTSKTVPALELVQLMLPPNRKEQYTVVG